MRQAKLIKKAELAEQAPPRKHLSAAPNQTLTNLTQKTVKQWLEARQRSRSQNPHAAFAALFTASA